MLGEGDPSLAEDQLLGVAEAGRPLDQGAQRRRALAKDLHALAEDDFLADLERAAGAEELGVDFVAGQHARYARVGSLVAT